MVRAVLTSQCIDPKGPAVPDTTTQPETQAQPTRYLAPDWFTRRVFNPLVGFFTRRGLSLMGSRVLSVRGRRSGELRTTVVNLLVMDEGRFLVAPRGHTHWTRNLRAATTAELRVGRRVEVITAEELPDDQKVPVLREYLRRWAWEVGKFFEGIDASSTDAELAAIAPDFPVFAVHGAP
jgi:deazaflavin-dependent oxidoreductase (nitroreductase family)